MNLLMHLLFFMVQQHYHVVLIYAVNDNVRSFILQMIQYIQLGSKGHERLCFFFLFIKITATFAFILFHDI